jgi:radical SAM protein with 4Fe4S-binding SPASM domain
MPVARVYLAPDASLKRLEAPYVYNRVTDDLFEVSEEAFRFLDRCAGGAPVAEADDEFLRTCLDEGLLERRPETVSHRPPRTGDRPSLRYLLVHLTDRCNLGCRHCYRAGAKKGDLSAFSHRRMLEEFEDGGGLRLLLSGGEPLLYPYFWQLNDLLPAFDIRVVLLTNGTLLDRRSAALLNVHEVQASLDGLEESHDRLRGPGAFRRALAGLEAARAVGLTVSVASTVNALNVDDFEALAEIVAELDVWQWTIDVPAVAGAMVANPELAAPLDRAAAALDLAMPAGNHGDNEGQLCGAHMAAVMPDGAVVKCGLLGDIRGGTLERGLRVAWRALPHRSLDGLGEPCRSCLHLEECRGGCRYRGGGLDSPDPDPVQCHRYGVLHTCTKEVVG